MFKNPIYLVKVVNVSIEYFIKILQGWYLIGLSKIFPLLKPSTGLSAI